MDELLATCLNGVAGVENFALIAPQDSKPPYSVYKVITNVGDNTTTGQREFKQPRYQLDIYTTTKSEGEALAVAIETALVACTDFDTSLLNSVPMPDDENEHFRYMLDFKLWK